MSGDRATARKNAYFQTPHVLFEDPSYDEMVGDAVIGWTLVRLTHEADRAWPAHPALPRWAKQKQIDYLVRVGLVQLLPNDLYTILALDAQRERASAKASKAGQASAEGSVRGKGGQFGEHSAPTNVGPK